MLAAMATLAALFLPACSFLQPAADVIARGIDEACERGMDPLAMEARRATVASINRATTAGNHTPSDCDNDGLPDFNIDANGIPLSDPVSDVPTPPRRPAELLGQIDAAPEVAAPGDGAEMLPALP
jgi:hypothetical protein